MADEQINLDDLANLKVDRVLALSIVGMMGFFIQNNSRVYEFNNRVKTSVVHTASCSIGHCEDIYGLNTDEFDGIDEVAIRDINTIAGGRMAIPSYKYVLPGDEKFNDYLIKLQ